MKFSSSIRFAILVAALAFTACPPADQDNTGGGAGGGVFAGGGGTGGVSGGGTGVTGGGSAVTGGGSAVTGGGTGVTGGGTAEAGYECLPGSPSSCASTTSTYTASTIAGACDTLTTPTNLVTASGDDTVSSVVSAPMPFKFYGLQFPYLAVSGNGLLQFFTTSSATVSSSFSNVNLPTTSDPTVPFLAPFWDDLNGGSRPTACVRFQVLGTSPSRSLVVEWTDFFNRDTSQHITYQAKLFETTNVIEYHYCTLNAGTATGTDLTNNFGGSATVGLQRGGGTGTRATVQSFNTLNSLSTTNAFRFTPSP